MSAPSSSSSPPHVGAYNDLAVGDDVRSPGAALESAATSWCGTPFCENSAKKGAGVCCHAAVAEVLFEAGIVPRFPYPFAPIKSVAPDRVDDFFADSPHFALVYSAGEAPAFIHPGDVLIFRAGRTCHFMLALSGGRFFHAMEKAGAGIAPNLPPKWRQRLIRVWRPVTLNPVGDDVRSPASDPSLLTSAPTN